jgi:hypothetical protein
MSRIVTVVEGCRVHGDKPLNEASKKAVIEVIKAVKSKMAEKEKKDAPEK